MHSATHPNGHLNPNTGHSSLPPHSLPSPAGQRLPRHRPQHCWQAGSPDGGWGTRPRGGRRGTGTHWNDSACPTWGFCSQNCFMFGFLNGWVCWVVRLEVECHRFSAEPGRLQNGSFCQQNCKQAFFQYFFKLSFHLRLNLV